MSPIVHADFNDFTVTNFVGDYYLTKNDPQGALAIHEQISVNFRDNNHGILRALPERYNGMPQHIVVEKVLMNGHAEPYTTYGSNGNLVLKIGDKNVTVTGDQNYEIDYRVENVMRFLGGTDELDWNVNGTQWQQPFTQVTARLHVPASLAQQLSGEACYVGQYGSTLSDCTVAKQGDAIVFTTSRSLQAGETLTFKANVPAGYFVKPTFKDKLADYARPILELTALPLIVFALAYAYWFKNGKDLKGRGTIIPEYGPPDGLRAAEVDVVASYRLGQNAISATIIDLAIRKYLRIQESESSGLLGIGKHKEYSFIHLPAPTASDLKDYESEILDGLFASGDTVGMQDLKNKFYKTAQSAQKSVPKALTSAGYFVRNPRRAGNGGHLLGALMSFVGFYLFVVSIALAIGVIISGIIIVTFASLMSRRTQKGVDAKDAIEGLKLYMNTAEKDRIAMLQSPSAPYAEKSSEPVKTVELFEKLLPYAMVLGVEGQWARQFESIYTTPPDWYAGNWATFNAIYLTNSLSSSMAAMNSSFAAPSSSGAGSGGGFSGGGGGGGGGGGW
ncbi:MAG: DUF2207 domain-containing protein [Candidatus Saccharimonadales bacterium]